MIVKYTFTEIEHTLYLFPFAKSKLNEYKRCIQNNKTISIEYYHYFFIVRLSEFWMSNCTNDEIEIIKMKFFERKKVDYISIQLGYKNHSSVIRKSDNIIKKLSSLNM